MARKNMTTSGKQYSNSDDAKTIYTIEVKEDYGLKKQYLWLLKPAAMHFTFT